MKPRRLPINAADAWPPLGRFDAENPDASYDEGGQWWMTAAETAPYSEGRMRASPSGPSCRGCSSAASMKGDRANVRGAARWKDGYWTLEAARDLKTGSAYDVDFEPGVPLYLWVAVFDHTADAPHAACPPVDP